MKRCSQCDFVYEDEQARCDMDGGELVYEPTLYPAAETATEVAPPMKFRSRSFILTAAATIIMGLFLGIGFFGLSNRSQSTSSPASETEPASVTPPAIVQPAMATTSSEVTPSPNEPTVSPAANLKSRNVATSASSSATKPAPTASRSPNPQAARKTVPTKTTQKEDSKVGSLLKKTGRVLKKPFSKW
jgi:cytoskeletal protein RodZ